MTRLVFLSSVFAVAMAAASLAEDVATNGAYSATRRALSLVAGADGESPGTNRWNRLRSRGDTLVLENGGFRVEIAPGLGGRITYYAAKGGSNAFWFAEADAPTEGWFNHGGEKTWIGPQSIWKRLAGRGWPPPPFFDQARYEIVGPCDGHSVTLVSPAGGGGVLRIARVIELLDDGALQVTSRFVSSGDDQRVSVDELRLWSVAQVPLPERVEAVDAEGSDVALVPAGEKKLHDGLRPEPLVAFIGAVQVVADIAAADGASAAVYFTGTNAPIGRRYAELEFSASASKGLAVRYRIAGED